jgi:hypothetical protein
MNVIRGAGILVTVIAVCVSAMLLRRRRAPEGSYFTDGDRASGVFGMLATGFSVLLAFMIFLAFESYDESRAGAAEEATVVAQQVETAQFLPSPSRQTLTGQLVCYGRSVAGDEWDALRAGTFEDAVNPWGAEMFRTFRPVEPRTASEQSAYDRWMDQTVQREQARIQRIHGAEGILPAALWPALYLFAAVIVGYALFFADRAEGAATQGMLMGSVAFAVTVSLLLLAFFDVPYGDGVGKLEPTAMERSLVLIEAEMELAGVDIEPPCDGDGTRR